MADKNKAKKRLARWDQSLWESRAWLFSTAQEFDDWCKEVQPADVCGEALSKAAKFFHLDEKKPGHRKLLLFVLAGVLFGDPARMGRPNKWHGRTYELLYDRAQATNGDERTSDLAAARMMKELFPQRYKHDEPDVLRKRLSLARRAFECEPEALRKKMWTDYQLRQKRLRQTNPVQ